MEESSFNFVDWICLCGYLLLILLLGTWHYRGVKDVSDFAVAGRSMMWLPVVMSIIASDLSAISYMGITSWVFEKDLQYAVGILAIPLAAAGIAVICIPIFYRLQVYTIFEYLEKRFNLFIRTLGITLFLLYRGGWLATIMYATSAPIAMITGLPRWVCILIMGVLGMMYAFMGIKVVIWVNVAQFLVLVGGGLVMAIFVLLPYQFDIVALWTAAGEHTKLFTWSVDPTIEMTIWAILLNYLFWQFSAWGTDQMVVQQYMTSKSLKQAFKSAVGSGFAAVPVMLLLYFVGVGFVSYSVLEPAVFADMENYLDVMPRFVIHVLPAGLRALVIAGIFAATLSSVEMGVSALATSSTVDYYRRFFHRPEKDDRHYLRVARLLTVFWGLVPICFALLLSEGGEQVFKYMGMIGGWFVTPLGALFLLGLLTRRANAWGAFSGVLVSVALNMYIWYVQDVAGRCPIPWLEASETVPKISWLWYAIIGFVVTLVLGYLLSLVFSGFIRKKSDIELRGLVLTFVRRKNES